MKKKKKPKKLMKTIMQKCKINSCSDKYYCKGYCSRHYHQTRSYGKVLKRTMLTKNKIVEKDNYCEMYLYDKLGKEVTRTKIDKNRVDIIKKYKWHLSHYGYVTTRYSVKLHQIIIGRVKGLDINNDKKDNRRNNLRHVTRTQNSMNRKVCGVYMIKGCNRWEAKIIVNGKNNHLGYFKTESGAIKARRKAELKYFNKYAYNYLQK